MTAGQLSLGDIVLQSGEVLPTAFLSYATYGTLNAAADNCVLLPTYYGGDDASYLPMIGPGRALDTERYFIVIPNMFGNGRSSSPSNSPWVDEARPFPVMSLADNVEAQARLLDGLGVREIALAAGWSMGAMQSYAWAIRHPGRVRNLLAWCGTAQCWPLNAVFLLGLEATLKADCVYRRGSKTQPTAGLRAFGRSYAGWAYSAAFYRQALFRPMGFADLEAFLTYWEDDHVGRAADDLMTMLRTWLGARPEQLSPGDDLATALGRITARTVVMPCDTDAYFTIEECSAEAALIPGARLTPLISPYGHCAGAPGRFPRETAAIEAEITELLERN